MKDYDDKTAESSIPEKVVRNSNNILLGEDKPQYESSYRATINIPKQAEVMKKIGSKKELSKTNFKLGNDLVDYTSNTSATVGKTFDRMAEQGIKLEQKQVKKSNTTSISLGQDPKHWQSSYTTQTIEATQPGTNQIQLNMNMQASNMHLGSDNDLFHTTAGGTYDFKPSNYQEGRDFARNLQNNLRSTNIEMGNFGTNYTTLAKESYVYKTEPIEFGANKIPNMRATNIIMGDEKTNYNSETHQMLTLKKNKSEKAAGILNIKPEEVRQSHLPIGTGKVKYESLYSAEYNQVKKVDPNTYTYGRDMKKDLQKEHFELGSMGNHYTTESKDHFNSKPIERRSDFKHIAKTQLQLSNDNVGYYQSQTRGQYYDKSKETEHIKVTKEEVNVKRSSQIKVGDDKPTYLSENKAKMLHFKAERNDNGDTKGYANSTHWPTGEAYYKDHWTTSSRDQMVWKQPIVRFGEY